MFNPIHYLFDSARDWVLRREMDINVPLKTRIEELGVKEYTREAFHELGIHTVRSALIHYCFDRPTPGVGEGSWRDLFDCVENPKK